MDRRSFIRGAGVAGTGVAAGVALAAPVAAQEAPGIKWRLASGYSKRLDVIHGSAVRFADTVREATDGKFEIEVSAAGELVDPQDGLDAVGDGTVDMISTRSDIFWETDPAFAFGSGVPFGLNQRMMNAWLYEGNGLRLLNRFYGKHGLIGFPCGNTGTQMGGWFRKEINSLDDLRGLNFRISGVGARIIVRIGVQPVEVPVGEIPEALESGRIDAAEFVGPYDDQKLGLNRVAKYYYYPGWWDGGVALMNLISLEKWNALPESYRAILQSASAATNLRLTARYDTLNPPALGELIEYGTVLRPYSHEIMTACFNAAEETYAGIAAQNADFRTLLESYMGYRRGAYLWFQMSEYAQDAFLMLQQRAGRL
jgi:TRAP-type mannitol/chloroaromatic compound transport system substrate-binding protein